MMFHYSQLILELSILNHDTLECVSFYLKIEKIIIDKLSQR